MQKTKRKPQPRSTLVRDQYVQKRVDLYRSYRDNGMNAPTARQKVLSQTYGVFDQYVRSAIEAEEHAYDVVLPKPECKSHRPTSPRIKVHPVVSEPGEIRYVRVPHIPDDIGELVRMTYLCGQMEYAREHATPPDIRSPFKERRPNLPQSVQAGDIIEHNQRFYAIGHRGWSFRELAGSDLIQHITRGSSHASSF